MKRLRWPALLLLLGCQSVNQDGAGAHGASGPGTSSAALSTSSAPAAAPSAPAPLAAPSPPPAPSGPPGVLKLASGATLTVPEIAVLKELKNASKRLPGVVKAAHKYELGGEKRLLLINEMDREGLSCNAVLDRERERANKAQSDTDPQRKAMRDMQGITELKLGDQRALYAVSANRAPSPSGSPEPAKAMMGVATLIMCQNDEYIVIMHAGDQATPAEETKKMLVTIAASYKPAG